MSINWNFNVLSYWIFPVAVLYQYVLNDHTSALSWLSILETRNWLLVFDILINSSHPLGIGEMVKCADTLLALFKMHNDGLLGN